MRSDCAALSILALYASAILAVCFSEVRFVGSVKEKFIEWLGITYSRGRRVPPSVFTLIPTHCFGRGMARKPRIINGPSLE
jgi:hypothetical protein